MKFKEIIKYKSETSLEVRENITVKGPGHELMLAPGKNISIELLELMGDVSIDTIFNMEIRKQPETDTWELVL